MFTDWLAATFYIKPEDAQMHQDVAAAQQAILDQQVATGKIGAYDYLKTSSDVQSAGNYTSDYVAANSGVWGFMKSIPWWLWLIIIFVPFGWLGGLSWFKGILKKK